MEFDAASQWYNASGAYNLPGNSDSANTAWQSPLLLHVDEKPEKGKRGEERLWCEDRIFFLL
jgi:hypothetical protein